MEDNNGGWETAINIFIALVVTALVTLVSVGILYSIEEGNLILLSIIISISIIIAICIVLYKFYALLNKIYKKLDSFDLPIKPQEEIKEESNDAQGQSEEEKGTHAESELDQWKSRAIQSVQKSLENGSINSAQARELIKRIQEAKQMPVKKNKEDAGA